MFTKFDRAKAQINDSEEAMKNKMNMINTGRNNKAQWRRSLWAGASLMALAAMGGTIPTASAETLKEALAAAYAANPDLEAQRAALRAIDEGVARSHAGFMPTVTGSASYAKSNLDSVADGQDAAGEPTSNQLVWDSTDKNYQARADLNLFNGFQNLNQKREADSLVEAGRAQLLAVEQQTLLNAVTAYMDVVRDEAVLNLNRNNVQVLERQLQASRDRFRVGEITRTDVAQSEARLEGARSAQISAEATLASSRAVYRQVIGNSPGTLAQPPALPILPANIEEALEIAIAENPNVALAQHNERAANKAVDRTKGTLMPQVNAYASIARSQGVQPTLQNEQILTFGTERTVKTIGLQAQWRLYQGGAEYSDVRRAKQVRSQRRLQIRAAERRAQANAGSTFEQYRASVAVIASSKSQVRANEIALEGVRQEAAVGSRTTLDVLNAEQELLDGRVNLVRAERNSYVAGFQLLSAVGRLNAVSLELPVDLYRPEEYYKDVRWKFVGWGTD